MSKKVSQKIVEVKESTAIVAYTKLDFDGLNGAIEQLGNSSKTLKPEEKKLGMELLEDWKNNVLDRLRNKEHELDRIEEFLGVKQGSWYGNNFEANEYQTLRENMASLSKTERQYTAYLEAKEAYELNKLKAPMKPECNPNLTEIQNDMVYGEYDREYLQWNIVKKQLEFVKTKAYSNWIHSMRKSKEVKDFLTGINSYKLVVKQYKNDAQIKCHKAKINLTISNKGVRESINEILDFARQIK